MRVASGPFSSNDDAGASSKERKDAFRRNIRKGQKVRATVLESVGAGHVWVKVAGLRLMAELPFTPFPGQVLFLVVEELDPKIILRLYPAAENAIKASLLGIISARNIISSAWLAFLHSLRPKNVSVHAVHASPAPSPNLGLNFSAQEVLPCSCLCAESLERKALWENIFLPSREGKEKEAAQNLLESETVLLNSSKARDRGFFLWQYVPWFTEEGKNQEIVILKQPNAQMEQIFFSGEWPQVGHAMLTVISLNGEINCKVHVQHFVNANEVCRLLNLPAFVSNLKVLTDNEDDFSNLWWLGLKEQSPESVLSIIMRLIA